MRYDKPGAGMRFMHCDDCGKEWKEPCRDATSQSTSRCITPFPECQSHLFGGVTPYGYELKPEWKLDHGGNLIAGEVYE